MKVLEQDEVNEKEVFCFETKVEALSILKKDLKIFKVDSNLEYVRLKNFILNSADSKLEIKDEFEDETRSISLIVEGRNDEDFS